MQESEGEDAETSRVVLESAAPGRAGRALVGRQSRVRLHEVGPRLELEIVKVGGLAAARLILTLVSLLLDMGETLIACSRFPVNYAGVCAGFLFFTLLCCALHASRVHFCAGCAFVGAVLSLAVQKMASSA